MGNVLSPKNNLDLEIRLAQTALKGYYKNPLRAIRVERYLARRHPELREELPTGSQYDFWSPLDESEVLFRLRWYIRRLGCPPKEKGEGKRIA